MEVMRSSPLLMKISLRRSGTSQVWETNNAQSVRSEAEVTERQIYALMESVENGASRRRVRREAEGTETHRFPEDRRVIDCRDRDRRSRDSNTEISHRRRQLSWGDHGSTLSRRH
jgi:hypothetical protein